MACARGNRDSVGSGGSVRGREGEQEGCEDVKARVTGTGVHGLSITIAAAGVGGWGDPPCLDPSPPPPPKSLRDSRPPE